MENRLRFTNYNLFQEQDPFVKVFFKEKVLIRKVVITENKDNSKQQNPLHVLVTDVDNQTTECSLSPSVRSRGVSTYYCILRNHAARLKVTRREANSTLVLCEVEVYVNSKCRCC